MAHGVMDIDLLDDLQQALTDFYDPPRLQENPLLEQLGLADSSNPAEALQSLLTSAIQSLRPDDSVPRHAPVHRYYLLLYQRYVEQFTQKEVAADLGLSVRQLRRLEKSALEILAAQIAPRRTLKEQVQTANPVTPSRQEELAWTQMTFPSDTAELVPLLSSVLQIADPLLQSLDVDVELALPNSLPRLVVQPMSLRQALLNIFTSVARRSSGTHLFVRATVQEQTVLLYLSVPLNEELAALAKQGGSENLRMARELVEPAGGSVAFTVADHLFEIRLYLPSEQQITVLAVDDNPDTLQLLSRYTANTRYHLVGVSQADRVLAIAQNLAPEIIILDVMMPQIDGWELLGKLRAHPYLTDVPLIVCTILPQEQLARSLGAAGFLRKPISRSDFLAALDAQMASLR